MRRVVVTGMGIVSCLGNTRDAVTDSLRQLKSGISFNKKFKEMGLRSQVCGSVDIDLDGLIDRKHKRFMGDAASYAYIALQNAITDAGLAGEDVANPRTGLIAGSGGASSQNLVENADVLRAKGVRRVGPYRVPRTMSSTVSACLATHFGILGLNYSVTSACATSTHCIGVAMEQIQWGKQDVIFAGGGEEEDWTLASMFDGMRALSFGYNDDPAIASRAYDAGREELEHAKARGAKIYAELVGYGATSDGANMVAPSGEGAVRCMQQAMATVDAPIDYINTHGTSTPLGDLAELDAIRETFNEAIPPFSSSKSLCGHSLGAAGVQEAVHCLLMLENDFMLGSANIFELDPAAEGMPILLETKDSADLNTVMSNNFGFGGTNASLVFQRLD